MNLRIDFSVAAVLVFLIAAFFPRFHAFMLASTGDVGDMAKVTLLGEYWNPDHRVRRAADSNLPDHLTLSVRAKRESMDLTFRMKRSRLLPLVTSDRRRRRSSARILQDAAVYTDPSMSSAIIVKRHANQYAMKGTFFHADTAWSIEHTDRQKREADETRDEDADVEDIFHWIVPLNFDNATISYVGDEVDPAAGARGSKSTSESDNSGSSESKSPGEQSGGDDRRKKRSVSRNVVKVAYVVDYSDYSKWVRLFGVDSALTELRLFYTYVAEDVKLRYESIQDPDFSISTTVTELKVLTNAADATFVSNLTNANGELNKNGILTAFLRWCNNPNNIARSDHYTLFTGFDLIEAAGVAYRSRVCTSEGISICENMFSGVVGKTTAHELGHSLSAAHDADTTNCTDNDRYIMASGLNLPIPQAKEGNPWTFSNCSIKFFKTYLNGVTCTRGSSPVSALPDPPPGERAGEVLDRDEQCRLALLNSSSHFCHYVQNINSATTNICAGMLCKFPNRNSCRMIIPQEFTSCRTNKWCRGGHCVSKDDDTTTTVNSTTSQNATASSSSTSRAPGATTSIGSTARSTTTVM